MHDPVHHTEDPELSFGDEKISLGTGRLDGDCPYQNLHVYVLNGVLAQPHEFECGEAFMGNWVEDGSSFLFFSVPAEDEIVKITMRVDGLEMVEKHVFPYDVWQGGPLGCVSIGEFVIVPPWLEQEAPETGMKIVLDPGVVFGNGLHPTTRDCLHALSLVAKDADLGVVLDLGTGTGVLSVAATLLGAKEVTGVDMNPLCVHTARRNVALNALTGVRVVEGDALGYTEKPADMLIANIPYAVTKKMLEKKALRSMKRMILSGLMRSQARELKAILYEEGFKLTREWDDQMTWYTFLFENRRNGAAYGA